MRVRSFAHLGQCVGLMVILLGTGSARAAEDFSGKALAGRDFAGQRLLEARFDQARLAGASFRGAVLRGATFEGADLAKTDFRQADLRGVSFKGASGLGSDPNAFRNALYSATTVWPEGFSPKNSGASLIESPAAVATAEPAAPAKAPRETGARPEPAMDPRPGSGVDMKGQDLSNKNFVGKYLNGANFDATKINFTTFNNAQLQGATFRAAVIVTGYFKGADLTGADFSGAEIQRVNFAGAQLNGAKLEGAKLMLNGWSGHFAPPKLNPDLNYSYEMKEAMAAAGSDWMHNHNLSLKGANLRGAKIAGNLETVDMRKTDLRGADLSEATDGENRFFKDAIYDAQTVWWKGFDPVKAGARLEASTPLITAAAAAPASAGGKGVAGYFWRIHTPGEDAARLLYIYPDGKYSWALGGGEYLDEKWSAAPNAAGAITLENGPGREPWTASLAGEAELALRSRSGRTLKGERGEPTKQ